MCGIFLAYSKKQSLNRHRCIRACDSLFNRGPDYIKYNFFYDDKLFIYNSVLSITGKKTKDTNLVKSKNSNYYIAFNGEIYNYLELYNNYLKNIISKNNLSDTEMLVNLHEVKNEIPKNLNGMFAYVILNNKKKEIEIVNDVQGEKNLYKYQDENFFLISSTINSILKYLNKIDLNKINLNQRVLKNYFYTRHFMPLNETCFKGIELIKNGTNSKFLINNKKLINSTYENPTNWISEKKYNYYNSLNEDEMAEYFENALTKQLKIMIPNKNFGCVVSGGIDSTLQAGLISKIKDSSFNLFINHPGKDKSINYINKFNNFFKNPIKVINSSKKIYCDDLNKCYDIISSPLQTHDLPGRMLLAKKFKEMNCKVFFSADGCDELFGSQQLYWKLFLKNKNYKKNVSPYSSINNFGVEFKEYNTKILTKKFQDLWYKTNEAYNFLSPKEKNIQSSLFLDYFIQSVGVANRSNDLISCDSSVEPRNVYIQKNILKIILNLPLKYKIDLFSKDKKMRQKKILKKIFINIFNKKLIYKKQGFPGYPNDVRGIMKIYNYNLTNKFLKIEKLLKTKYYDSKNFIRDLEWKFINMEIFLKKFLTKNDNTR
jgi:asparagine synthase (glutamine-hydrolysing)